MAGEIRVKVSAQTREALRKLGALESDIKSLPDGDITVEADTSKAQRDLGGLNDSLDDLANALPGVSGGMQGLLNPTTLLGGAAVGGALALNQMADSALATAQHAELMAEKLNVSIKRAQELSSIAKIAGVDVEKFENALYEINNRLGELSTVGTGPAADALKILNLELKDLQQLPVDEQLRTIVRETLALEDAAQRTFVQEELLGGAAEDLTAILKIQDDEWKKLNDTVKEFNHLTDEQVKSLNEERQAMAASNEEIRLASEQIGLHLVPAKRALFEVSRDVVTQEKNFQQALGDSTTTMLGWDDVANKIRNTTQGLIDGNLGHAESTLQSSMMVKGYAADLEQTLAVTEKVTEATEANTKATQEHAIKTEFGIDKAREYRERQAELTEEFQMQFPELVKNTEAERERTQAVSDSVTATKESTTAISANRQALENNNAAMERQIEWLDRQRAKTLESRQESDIFRLSLGATTKTVGEYGASSQTAATKTANLESNLSSAADSAQSLASQASQAAAQVNAIPSNKTVTITYNTVRRGQNAQSDKTSGESADESTRGGTTGSGQKYEGPSFSYWAQAIRGLKIPRYPFDSEDGQATQAAAAFVAALTGEHLGGTQLSIKEDRRKYTAALNKLKGEFAEYKKNWTPMAKGGIVPGRAGGVPAVVGEGGSSEAVIPLDQFWAKLDELIAVVKNQGTQPIIVKVGDKVITDLTWSSGNKNKRLGRRDQRLWAGA